MKGVRTSSKSGLFLMELIIAIAFFAFASAICIQLFAKAHTLSGYSRDLGMALSAAQSAAECFKSTGADPGRMGELLSATPEGESLLVYYDGDWKAVGAQESPRYCMTVQLNTANPLARADITVNDLRDQSTLYLLTASKYLP